MKIATEKGNKRERERDEGYNTTVRQTRHIGGMYIRAVSKGDSAGVCARILLAWERERKGE